MVQNQNQNQKSFNVLQTGKFVCHSSDIILQNQKHITITVTIAKVPRGGFPQQWHFSQLQAHVEYIFHNPAQLVCTGLEEPGADPIWTRSLLHLHLPQLISHLER